MCTGVYWCVLVCTGVYWGGLGCTGVYWCVLVCTGVYWGGLGCTKVYWGVLVCTGVYLLILTRIFYLAAYLLALMDSAFEGASRRTMRLPWDGII